jgi:hypothetical protein
LKVLILQKFMESGDFTFFQKLFLLNLVHTWTFYLPLGFLFHDEINSLKIPQDLLVLWKFFVPLFSAGWI